MVEWDYQYFTPKEVSCRCGCGKLPQDWAMKTLVTMREEAGFPFVVSSGARCVKHNAEVSRRSGAKGPHVIGVAFDIVVHGLRAFRIITLALKHGVTGLGLLQEGVIEGRFVHLDWMKPEEEDFLRPNVWTYSLKEEENES